MMILRQAIAILLLPFMVVVVVPRWLLHSPSGLSDRWSESPLANLGQAVGVFLFLLGFCLFVWCVMLFARVGQGTLAPWDATRRLVAVGPYRYVRNPMITSVVTMLAGEALFFGSTVLAGWLVLFFVLNHVYFILLEEPSLEQRFGASYAEYKKRVPRWLPRRPR